MTTPAGTISIADVHTELDRVITCEGGAFLNFAPPYGVRFGTSTTSPLQFYMSSAQPTATERRAGTYIGKPFRLVENEPVVYTPGTGSVSRLTNGTTYYIRDIAVNYNDNQHFGVNFKLSETPGGTAIIGGSGNVLTAGSINFTRPLSSVSLNDYKIRSLSNQMTGSVSMSALRSLNAANMNRNSPWSYSVQRRKVPNYSEIQLGSGGILTKWPIYASFDEFFNPTPYTVDSTDFYLSLGSNFDGTASNQDLNMTIVIDFSYATNFHYAYDCWFVPIPFIRSTAAGYSFNYPFNDAVTFNDYANPGWASDTNMYFSDIFSFSDSGGYPNYRRGYVSITKPLALASPSAGWSYGFQNYRGYWDINRMRDATHMISVVARMSPNDWNEAYDAVRIYGMYVGLNYGYK